MQKSKVMFLSFISAVAPRFCMFSSLFALCFPISADLFLSSRCPLNLFTFSKKKKEMLQPSQNLLFSLSLLLNMLLKLDTKMIRCGLLAPNCISSTSLTLTDWKGGTSAKQGSEGSRKRQTVLIAWQLGVRDGGFTLCIHLLLFPRLPPDDVHSHTRFVVPLL